ncbi:MAG: hypothetical protein JWN17_175 [Frankiales bacterium]|nr:hypothetical protein [Frankiales bacterium]
MRFKKVRGGGVSADVAPVEAHVLAQCAADLLALLAEDEDEDAPAQDPLAAMVGMPTGDVEAPDDPALARLLPDAYGDDDPEASREFRRYTDSDLRAGKSAHAGTVLATLPPEGGRLLLDRDGADAWLGCLNDLRLVLGTRLEVTEELDETTLPEDDPRQQALQVYGWLGWLQESLISCLSPRR